ncbi:Ger(x)C family spore germination protein [Paenibacillus sp.]|uniref:Ger(x)C family spore germination protein n=1 Tax=Paenibacillus sp. TaxID=58172 RepID=UPI0028A7FC66|nr:Ger(x)C family spore germination protein [Paenibacillus sp.]
MRKWRMWIVLSVLCILLSGCWSSSPIEELNMGIGVALDSADETGDEEVAKLEGGNHTKSAKIISTYQFTIPQGSGGAIMKSSASSSSFKNYYNMSETSDSIFEAIRQLSLRTRRTPIGHHLKVIVISEKLARSKNLTELIDFFTRDNNIRPSVMLFVSKGKAKDVLENALPGQTPAFVLEGIYNNRDRNMGIWEPVSLAKVVGPLQGKRSFLLQNVIPFDKETNLAGAGVIKGTTGKLVGFLDESELEGMAWLTGKGLGGVLKTYDPDNNNLITYEVKSVHSKIKANVNNGQISFDVKIKSTGRYAEVFGKKSKKLHDGIVKKDKAVLQKRVIEMVQTTVKKMQKDLHTEAAGFGTSLRIQHPAVWRSVKDNWDETFSQIPITYEVNLSIEEYGASDTAAE